MAAASARHGFKALHEAHAIEQVVVAIQFGRVLNDVELRAGHDAIAAFGSELPGGGLVRAMELQIGPGGLVPFAAGGAASPVNGYLRTLSDGRGVVIKELKLDRQALTFTTQAYTRWEKVWAETHKYFDAILLAIASVPVAAYSLTYVDKFIWSGPSPEAGIPAMLLRKECPFIAPCTYAAENLWHSYSGQFIRINDYTKRLQVVNLDCLDETDSNGFESRTSRVIRITTALTNIFNQPEYSNHNIEASAAIEEIDVGFDELHDALKKIFGLIVNDQILELVGMGEGNV